MLTLITAFIANPAAANDVSPAVIRAAIEGTWVLEEWRVDGFVLRPPMATGRMSFHDNVIMITGTGKRGDRTRSFYAYGSYEVGESTWSYGYQEYVAVREAQSTVSIARDLPWKGLRQFQARIEENKLILDFEGGNARIVISGDDFAYNETGTLVRRWTRIAP